MSGVGVKEWGGEGSWGGSCRKSRHTEQLASARRVSRGSEDMGGGCKGGENGVKGGGGL